MLVKRRLTSSVRPRDSVRAVDELIDPTEVLVPVDRRGVFDFGHLRFQEYLAAVEMSQNRAIDVTKYVADDWWQDAFVLFAQITTDFMWLVDRLSRDGRMVKSARTIRAMVGVLPEPKRSEMIEVIERRTRLERVDGAFAYVDLLSTSDFNDVKGLITELGLSSLKDLGISKSDDSFD